MKYILCIDAGTTGVTLLLIDKETNVIEKEYAELQQWNAAKGGLNFYYSESRRTKSAEN